MASRSGNLEELRRAVLGNQRGREVEVASDGQIITPESGQNPESPSAQESEPPRPSRMSTHTWGI